MNGDFRYSGGDQLPLRAAARRAISSGVIPARKSIGTWGGFGSGTLCCICGESILPEHLEFEVDFSSARGDAPLPSYHLHAACFHAWEAERDAAATSLLKGDDPDRNTPRHERDHPTRGGRAK